ncbi:MAG: Uma2 family endonuclease, partial [Thiobacillaceae bacterium]|nr:Uma2 family endonuclease [Thiobacillaceae bacterium]MCX7672234.1 Uma2 family endonuclease [Thiobacillaceae bacterium]
MGHALSKPQHYTYADYCTWPEDERCELIDGVAYAMAPAPTRSHQLCVVELSRQVATALKGGPCQVFVAPFDVRLPHADEADERVDTVVQPDVLAVCDASKVDERGVRG